MNSVNFKDLFTNPVFLSCIFSWFCAQFIKTIINVLYGRIHNTFGVLESLIWRTGGLPSSHSALVASLATSIGLKDGLNSDTFILAFCFLMVTVRDAAGVRRSNGIQGKKLNEIGKVLQEKGLIEYFPAKEVEGHTPLEVTFGCILGFFIALSFYWN